MIKERYESPNIQCYEIETYCMTELSVPKGDGDSTDEQCSKKNFFDGEFEEEENANQ
jgi:hypothetical protein